MFKPDHPTASNDQYTEGNISQGIPATVVTADHLNAITNEISHIIEQAGIALDKTNSTQLKAAVLAMIGSPIMQSALKTTVTPDSHTTVATTTAIVEYVKSQIPSLNPRPITFSNSHSISNGTKNSHMQLNQSNIGSSDSGFYINVHGGGNFKDNENDFSFNAVLNCNSQGDVTISLNIIRVGTDTSVGRSTQTTASRNETNFVGSTIDLVGFSVSFKYRKVSNDRIDLQLSTSFANGFNQTSMQGNGVIF